jgi:hypothetical protein
MEVVHTASRTYHNGGRDTIDYDSNALTSSSQADPDGSNPNAMVKRRQIIPVLLLRMWRPFQLHTSKCESETGFLSTTLKIMMQPAPLQTGIPGETEPRSVL